MSKIFNKVIFVVFVMWSALNMAQTKDINRYIKTETGYLMVLRESDNVIEAIENLAKQENIPSANFSGIGFADEVNF